MTSSSCHRRTENNKLQTEAFPVTKYANRLIYAAHTFQNKKQKKKTKQKNKKQKKQNKKKQKEDEDTLYNY